MNKKLFEYCQRHLRLLDHGRFKESASFRRLVEDYNVGCIKHGFFYFEAEDKLHLLNVIKQQLNGLRLSDAYPQKLSRVKKAQHYRNEKQGAIKVSENFVLVNSLHSLCLNQQTTNISALNGLGHFIHALDLKTVEHQQIILVENLAVMANLATLNIPQELQAALWLYRGDTEKHKQTATAATLFRSFQKTNQLICFSDFDPAGLQTALTCGATQWLTLAQTSDINIILAGHEQEWFKQVGEKNYLANTAQLSAHISALFATMNNNQKTLKQEHIIAHALSLKLYPLSD
ncbi:MAG: hypothetical protein V5786_09605 [Psychromonas sp.]